MCSKTKTLALLFAFITLLNVTYAQIIDKKSFKVSQNELEKFYKLELKENKKEFKK